MNHKISLYKKIKLAYRAHKLAIRIFTATIILFLILNIVFTAIGRKRNSYLVKESQASYAQLYLNGIIHSTDLIFTGLNQTVSQLVSDTNVQSLLYSHSINDQSANRVRLTMSEITDKNLLIDNMIFF